MDESGTYCGFYTWCWFGAWMIHSEGQSSKLRIRFHHHHQWRAFMCKVVRVLKTQQCVPHSYSWGGFRCIIVIHGVGFMFDVVFMRKWVSLKKVKVSNCSFLSTITIKGGHLRNLKSCMIVVHMIGYVLVLGMHILRCP